MTPSRKMFWLGYLAGLGLVTLAIAAWIGWAVWTEARSPHPDFGVNSEMTAALPSLELEAFDKPETATYDWTVTTLDGDTLSMSTFQDRTILLSFWGTWCAPCRAEMPSLARLAARLEDRDEIALVLVSNEEIDRVRAYAETQPSTMPFYVTDDIPSVLFPSVWPTASVIGCDGQLVARHVGGANWDSVDVVEFLVDQAEATCA